MLLRNVIQAAGEPPDGTPADQPVQRDVDGLPTAVFEKVGRNEHGPRPPTAGGGGNRRVDGQGSRGGGHVRNNTLIFLHEQGVFFVLPANPAHSRSTASFRPTP